MVYGSCWAPIKAIPYAFGQVTLIYGKSRTTDEAHQVKRAPFSFSPIVHAKVGSIGSNLGSKLSLESLSKRDKSLVHWSNTHFLSQSMIIKISIPSYSTSWGLFDERIKSYGFWKMVILIPEQFARANNLWLELIAHWTSLVRANWSLFKPSFPEAPCLERIEGWLEPSA